MYSLVDKYNLIKNEILKSTEKDPIQIIKNIMRMDFINIHGPEHHFLDGASFLAAYKNAGGNIDLSLSLDKLMERAMKMPGAMCGEWGVCGASASVGASLAVINKTGPLTNNDYYSNNMELTSNILNRMSHIGGPRCCKRNAFISLTEAVNFVNAHYNVQMELSDILCEFSQYNEQCLKDKCPFHKQYIK